MFLARFTVGSPLLLPPVSPHAPPAPLSHLLIIQIRALQPGVDTAEPLPPRLATTAGPAPGKNFRRTLSPCHLQPCPEAVGGESRTKGGHEGRPWALQAAVPVPAGLAWPRESVCSQGEQPATRARTWHEAARDALCPASTQETNHQVQERTGVSPAMKARVSRSATATLHSSAHCEPAMHGAGEGQEAPLLSKTAPSPALPGRPPPPVGTRSSLP